MSHTENYICGFFCYDQTSCYFPWNEVTAWQTFLLSSLKKCWAGQDKRSVVTFWNVILCHGDLFQKTSNDSHRYENFKWHKIYPAFMRLEDLSSLTWHSYICPKMAQPIFIIFTLIPSSTYAPLPCGSSHLTSFVKILYPVTCPA